jgi:hypothetical protein
MPPQQRRGAARPLFIGPALPVTCLVAARPTRTAPTCAAAAATRGRARKSLGARLAHLLKVTRPGAMDDSLRFASLPEAAKTDSQMLGRLSAGCEGTKGVFPKCNFGCKPCYHSADANQVAVDGLHTALAVAAQMAELERVRGPVGHCQLIGGEVSLLSPEDHLKALEIMRFYGRIPMSFTHGDFDYEYLKRIAVGDDGKPRFDRLDFAVHFDSFMYGRTGIERPTCEADLAPYRRKFIGMFHRLNREHGVKFYVAHNVSLSVSAFSVINRIL